MATGTFLQDVGRVLSINQGLYLGPGGINGQLHDGTLMKAFTAEGARILVEGFREIEWFTHVVLLYSLYG